MKSINKLLFLLLLVACQSPENSERLQTETGLQYIIHRNEAATKAAIGDIIEAHLRYGTSDSLLFDSQTFGKPVYIQLTNPAYPGSFEEGLAMLGAGDSATFYLQADSVFSKIFRQPLPAHIKAGSELYFTLGVLAVRNEEKELQAWLQREAITPQIRPSGLMVVPMQAPKAAAAKAGPGDKVKVHYAGYLLDGTKFDASTDRGEPFQFVIGKGQVIPGWDEGVNGLHVGEKVKLIVPSYLAYGPRGASNTIAPYSTLVFEVELLAIVDQP
jgi:FKBP-type peptidyl-prolyl cis-trans isomerase